MTGPVAQHDADPGIFGQSHRRERSLDPLYGFSDLAPAIVCALEIDFDTIGFERHDRAQLFGHQGHQSAKPPLASMICPVTQRASSPRSIITAPAISSGSPSRPIGVCFAVASSHPGCSRSAVIKSVATAPGAMQLQVICRLATVSAVEKVRLWIARFVMA